MSYKKKKDTMTKEEMRQEIEFWQAEYNRAKVVQRKIEAERDEALEILNAMPDIVRQMYEKRAKRRTIK